MCNTPVEPEPQTWEDLDFPSDALAEVVKYARWQMGYSVMWVEGMLYLVRDGEEIGFSLDSMKTEPLQTARNLWELLRER